MNDRFTLEEKISKMLDVSDMIDDLIFKIGDSKCPANEDDVLNALIGMQFTLNARHEQVWTVFEDLIKRKIIT
jgi:hypothetical protein